MKELQYFKSPENHIVTAAMAGVPKDNWTSITKGSSSEMAFKLMSQNRFDILPVEEKDGSFKTFYKNITWGDFNYNNIERLKIKSDDCLYFLTSIQDIVLMFCERITNFFFLENMCEVIGLITISDLNQSFVYSYIYNQILEIEKALSSYIARSEIYERNIFEALYRDNSPNAKDALIRFEEDRILGIDRNLIEYLFLPDLFKIIRGGKLLRPKDDHWDSTNSKISKISAIRNIVAHPVRNLIINEKSINDVHLALTAIDEMKIYLHDLECLTIE